MGRHRSIALVMALAFAVSPVVALAADKQITDVKELAGTWQGWAKSQLAGDGRVIMTIKPDGSYQANTTADGGTLTVGKYYLEGGKLKYRSSRTEGTAVVSEEKGKLILTIKPEGSHNANTGPAFYERMK